MKTNRFYLVLLFIFILIHHSIGCSIFSSLNCSCFQSADDLNDSTRNKTHYSHLYCQGEHLNATSFDYSSNFDRDYSKTFRTISIEFSIDDQIEILSNQFDPLGKLVLDRNPVDSIEIFLRFRQFHRIKFHSHSITSNIFGEKHSKKFLSLDFIPTRDDRKQIDDDDDQLYFVPNCFSSLNLTEMKLSIYTKDEKTSKNSSFEEIFNETSIDELHIYGSIVSPSNLSEVQRSFIGSVRSLFIHRRVDTIESTTFPFYPHVKFYSIDSIGAHSMNLKTFVGSYENLHRLEILEPRFDIEINEFLPSLESLTIDVEHFHEKTLFAARHIQKLKFGSRLRHLDRNVLVPISKFRRLRFLDLSDVNLSQMTIESRCFLLEYLQKIFNSQFQFLFPQIENSTDCQCEKLYLLHLISFSNDFQDSICSKQCQMNSCRLIREYFQTKDFSTSISNENLPIIDLSLDSFDEHLFPFVYNPTEKSFVNSSLNIDQWNISTLENLQEYEENPSSSTIDFFSSFSTTTTTTTTHSIQFERTNQTKISLIILISFGSVFLLIFLTIVVVLCILMIRSRRRHRSKSVPVEI